MQFHVSLSLISRSISYIEQTKGEWYQTSPIVAQRALLLAVYNVTDVDANEGGLCICTVCQRVDVEGSGVPNVYSESH